MQLEVLLVLTAISEAEDEEVDNEEAALFWARKRHVMK